MPPAVVVVVWDEEVVERVDEDVVCTDDVVRTEVVVCTEDVVRTEVVVGTTDVVRTEVVVVWEVEVEVVGEDPKPRMAAFMGPYQQFASFCVPLSLG